ERFDGNVDAGATGEALDLFDDVDDAVIEDDVHSHLAGHNDSIVVAIDPDDHRRAHQLCAERGAETDRALGEDGHGVADSHAAGFGAADSGGGDVGEEDD